ncbi:GNAT family N-acetyltransferase [Testudinibacter sp. TR-2022]|uniref:GNAT family N-acetyltransferase n=1 Tax=Testudinibacter sp. TR-2022 TaxID=2585029 RepID=UPI00111AC002|nr:GNAT family N-acetyltransferase [Testudinibacter sp. TR-2022]TNH04237.1 GNAT family N-acetyltransferase [Pasteurellaceae bacterium Phil31]TNH09420.1 GNAT family N-acetyltransferase [Testudinibacter sp. TR-2022]TNH11088.1 GNAT family N-acetyltransferase [Testudinibacter sp. TR-2022]
MKYCAPEPLTSKHRVQDFVCGEPILDHWLQKNALKNQLSRASRTFVVCDESHTVVAYYAIASGSITHQAATGKIRRNMPNPIPVIVLGRLAVDQRLHGQHLGASLLKDVILRVHRISEQVGVRALLVHALNENAKQFYLAHGFSLSPLDDMILMLKL